MKAWRKHNMKVGMTGQGEKISRRQVRTQFTFINQIPSTLLMNLFARVGLAKPL